jgi:ADP-ribose pyrophosphatase YjhB (NUDIX family)
VTEQVSRNFLVNVYYRSITRGMRTLQWLLGASTVGVRTLVINKAGEILLVKHTYMKGWHFPGGGVFPGEPAKIAAIRELREESGLLALGHLELFGVYYHQVMRVNDYIALYIVKEFSEMDIPLGGEIASVKWFPLENLPKDITRGTRARIAEYFFNQPQSDHW